VLPEQVESFWPLLRSSLKASAGTKELSETTLTRNLTELMQGKMCGWVVLLDEKPLVVLTTSFSFDVDDTKALYITSITGYGVMYEEIWEWLFESFRRYAKSRGCRSVVTTTRVKELVELGRKFGADVEEVVLRIEVT